MQQARSPCRSPGFSLVELMVGLLIGMVALIVMMQVFSVSEGYKRTTTGGDDAQNNGAIALYGLQRDIQQSGLGASGFPIIGCNVQLRAGVTVNTLSPVTINYAIPPGVATFAHDANTDTLLVVYGNANGEDEGEAIQAQPNVTTYTVAAATASASGPGAFAIADKVIAEAQPRPTSCNLTMDTVTGVAAANVSVSAGVAGMSNGILYNLGQAPKVLVYAVQGGNLTVCDYVANDCGAAGNVGNAAVWVPIASNIVSLRAEYGRDTTATMDGTVDTYDQTFAEATYGVACAHARVSALRLALVARSAEFDKKFVATAPAWASSNVPIDLSATPNWQQYHYKLFQTTVPLRNMAWQGAQAGC